MKTVVVGANGFVGKAVMRALAARGQPALGLTSAQLDLRDTDRAADLADALAPDDSLVFLAALTPRFGRGADIFAQNIRMAETACLAFRRSAPRHTLYLGTDAIYPFADTPTDESTRCVVDDFYAAAHRVRELMFLEALGAGSLAIVRPSMIYGSGDPHNAYGPNRFVRSALSRRRIEIFGAGEELRDHIAVEDVAELICDALARSVTGIVNFATGVSTSYADLAASIAELAANGTSIIGVDRAQPVWHRRYDVAKRRALFPDHTPRSLRAGLAEMIEEFRKDGFSE